MSKQSLDEILLKLEDYYNTVYNGVLPSKNAMDRARAKQAIVEAVEGLAPAKKPEWVDSRGPARPTLYDIPAHSYNQAVDDFLQAIKEWQ